MSVMRIVIVVAVMAISSCTTIDPVTAEKNMLARQLVDTQFQMSKFQRFIDLISDQVAQISRKDGVYKQLPITEEVGNPDKLFEYVMKDLVKRNVNAYMLEDIMVDFFAEKFSSSDLETIIAFYHTSVGAKLSQMIDVMLDETSVNVAQKRSLFGKDYIEAKAEHTFSPVDYDRMFKENLSEEEYQAYYNFLNTQAGAVYLQTLPRYGRYLQNRLKEKFSPENLREELRYSVERLIGEYGKDYFKR